MKEVKVAQTETLQLRRGACYLYGAGAHMSTMKGWWMEARMSFSLATCCCWFSRTTSAFLSALSARNCPVDRHRTSRTRPNDPVPARTCSHVPTSSNALNKTCYKI